MDRDTLWFRRSPPRRSRVTHMNREEKVSPTYHHRRSTGAPILSQPGGPRLDLQWGVRGLDRLQRECGLWTVGIACGRRCSPGSRGADVSRHAGRRNSDGRVKTPPCGMCAERVAALRNSRHRVEGSGGQRRQRYRACTGASILSPMGCASRRARSSRRAGSFRDAQSEMRYQQTKPWAWMGAAKPWRSG